MTFFTRYSYVILLLLMLLETLFLFYFNQTGLSHPINSVLYFCCSVLFGVILLARFYKKRPELKTDATIKLPKTSVIILVTLALLVFCVIKLTNLFESIPTEKSSDIIPTVEVVSKRLIAHVPVYRSHIYAVHHLIPITYLPMHWLPYTISSYFNFDARWITFSIWLLAVLVFCIRNYRYENLTPILSVGLLAYMIYRNDGILSSTIELMVAGYYILLIMAFDQKNAVVTGLMIGVCLLSRYSLVLWLPLLAFILFISQRRKDLWIICGVSVAFVLLVYVIPFLSANWGAFTEGYNYYSHAALGEWRNGDIPFHLQRGTGFAYFFFTGLDMPIEDKLKVLQRTHLIASLGITLIMGLWYMKHKKKIDTRIFILGSFKIYLAVFLVLIQVPYEYLMIVGNFVSIAIFCEQARYRLIKTA